MDDSSSKRFRPSQISKHFKLCFGQTLHLKVLSTVLQEKFFGMQKKPSRKHWRKGEKGDAQCVEYYLFFSPFFDYAMCSILRVLLLARTL